MEASRNAVAAHTARRGHMTDIEEVVLPAVTWEHNYPTQHEVTTEAVDREVHQHHYHTTVQPLAHTEALPTKHTHNLLPTKHVGFEHDDKEKTQRRVAEVASQFVDNTSIEPTTRSSANMPTVIGEHYHHHVRETVQPIIYKETIQEEYVHTTVPVHETHYMLGKHHAMSALPTKTMAEFLASTASARKGERTFQSYQGIPRDYDTNLGTTFEELKLNHNAMSSRDTAPLSLDTNRNESHGTAVSPSRNSGQYNTDNDSVLTKSTSLGASSIQSPSTPKTPRSSMAREPRSAGVTTNTTTTTTTTTSGGAYRSLPTKSPHADRPLKIVGADGADGSPRSSGDTSHGRNSFMNKLTGRV